MLDINSAYQITIFTSGFVFFAFLFVVNKCKYNEPVNITNPNFDIESAHHIMNKSKSCYNIANTYKCQEKLITYSYTYASLLKVVPPNSPSKIILYELIKNKNNEIMNCCNPSCKRKINNTIYFAFDGYYCNESCRHFVSQNIYNYWKQI